MHHVGAYGVYQCRGKHEQSRLHRHKPSSCNQRTNDGLHMALHAQEDHHVGECGEGMFNIWGNI